MKIQVHLIAFFGYLGNIFLAVTSLKMRDVDMLLAIVLKGVTIVSTITITIYYIRKLYKENKNENSKKPNPKR